MPLLSPNIFSTFTCNSVMVIVESIIHFRLSLQQVFLNGSRFALTRLSWMSRAENVSLDGAETGPKKRNRLGLESKSCCAISLDFVFLKLEALINTEHLGNFKHFLCEANIHIKKCLLPLISSNLCQDLLNAINEYPTQRICPLAGNNYVKNSLQYKRNLFPFKLLLQMPAISLCHYCPSMFCQRLSYMYIFIQEAWSSSLKTSALVYIW